MPDALGPVGRDDNQLDLVLGTVLGRRAGDDDPAGVTPDERAGRCNHLVDGVHGHAGQIAQLEAVGGEPCGLRDQVLKMAVHHALGHVDAAVLVTHHRIRDDQQAGVLFAQWLQPLGQHGGLAGTAQIAHQHGTQLGQRAPGLQIGQVAGKPVVRNAAAVDGGIVGRVAEHHGGHDGHFQTGTQQHGGGHVVAHPPVDHLGLDRNHVEGQGLHGIVEERLSFGGRKVFHGEPSSSG